MHMTYYKKAKNIFRIRMYDSIYAYVLRMIYPLKKNTVTEPEYIFSLYIYIFLIHTILKNIFVLLDIHLQYNYHVDYLVHQYHLDYQMGQRHEKN